MSDDALGMCRAGAVITPPSCAEALAAAIADKSAATVVIRMHAQTYHTAAQAEAGQSALLQLRSGFEEPDL
jgi:hypothetical protein